MNKPKVDLLESMRFKSNIYSPTQQCQLSLGSKVKAAVMSNENKVYCDVEKQFSADL